MPVHLPQPKQVRDLLVELLGRDVTLSPSAPFAPGPDTAASIAVYVDDSLQIRALMACDLAVDARAGAAIGLVPVGGAEAAIEEDLGDRAAVGVADDDRRAREGADDRVVVVDDLLRAEARERRRI